jgi:HEPN domain-containing protein
MRKETEEWIKIAGEDLQSAVCLLEKSVYRMACYHAQQTVEKFLKAILVEKEIDVPRIHNLLDLNNAAKKLGHETPLLDEDAVFLNSIYRSRYPLDTGLLPWGEPTEKDAIKALDIAKNISVWFKETFK